MNDDDGLIELLNGFGAGSTLRNFDTEVFLDEDGMPTDRFLQALKSDMSMLPAFEDKDHSSNIYHENITHQLDREFSPGRNGSYKNRYASSNHTQNANKQSERGSREFKTDNILDEFADFQFSGDEVDLSMLRGNTSGDSKRRPNASKTENLSATFKKLITDDPYFDNVKQKRKVQFNQEQNGKLKNTDGFVSSAPFTSAMKAATAAKEDSKPKKKKAPVTATKASPKTPTYMADHRAGSAQGSSGASSGQNTASPGTTSDEIHFPRAVGIDTTEIEVEAESRVKSLQLRLQGQLQTIRSLEAQLGDALQLLEARNKQLAHCNARLKATASSSAQNASNSNASAANSQSSNGGNLRSEATAAKATELAEQYKVQADFLQAKLTEEQARRQRAEERARVLKNYSEKAKERCLALEGQNAELRGAITEMTTRMEKYRKSYKDIASESAAQKNELSAKEEESAKVKRQLDKTESAVRNLQMALEHSREELRTQKVETSAAQSRYKQLALQVEIQSERDATKRAEERLRGMESVRKGSNSNSESHHHHHHSQHIHDRTKHSDGHIHSQSEGYTRTSYSPQRDTSATVTAEQQLQYLQHLAGVSANKRQSPERAHHQPASSLNLGARFDQHLLDQPPVPHYAQPTARGSTSSADYSHTYPAAHAGSHHGSHSLRGSYDESVRSFIEHEEGNLDRDVVLESLQALQGLHSLPLPLPPQQSAHSHSHSHGYPPPGELHVQDKPPRWRSPPNQQGHQKSHIVNAVLRNSFDSSRSSAGASPEYSHGQDCTDHQSSSSAARREASRGPAYASVSDSELEHPDRRHRSNRHSPERDRSGSEHSTVSFIRQRVMDSGHAPATAIGRSRSTPAGGSDAYQSGSAQPTRSSHVPSNGHGQGAGIASSLSDASAASSVNKVNSSHGSSAPSSGGKMPLNRLQALYDKVTNKTS